MAKRCKPESGCGLSTPSAMSSYQLACRVQPPMRHQFRIVDDFSRPEPAADDDGISRMRLLECGLRAHRDTVHRGHLGAGTA
jgi:hypothetical protein